MPSIGIREFVEFVVRSGDLNPITTNSTNTAQIGSRIHRKLQESHHADYESEVYLSTTVKVAGEEWLLEGRADGLDTSTDTPLIEEIKTSSRDWEAVTPNTKERYWAQARIYAHLLCLENAWDEIDVQLIYVQTEDELITRFTEHHTAQDLADEFSGLVDEFADWLQMRQDIVTRRDASLETLSFPFPAYRAGQHELASAVYKTIYAKQRLFVEAPTGTGKTISTLFPTLKAMGAGLIQRAFYLTAKQSTRRVAEEALVLLSEKGFAGCSITLTAKDTITFADEPEDPSLNPYMLGYYDRLKPALKDALTHERQLTRERIEYYAHKHQLDPFEFSLDLSLFCDVIICDYNYLFDPAVFLQRFFAQKDPNNFFLIDEAHNLVSRAREMYSAELDTQSLASLSNALAPVKSGLTAIKRGLTNSLNVLDSLATQLSAPITFQDEMIESLNAALERFTSAVRDWLALPQEQRPETLVDQILPVFFNANSFLRIVDFYDGAFTTEIRREGNNTIVKLLCLDPSSFLDETMAKGCGAVLFSATLSPLEYYQDVLGGGEDSLAYQLNSPFTADKLFIDVTRNITPTYRNRQSSLPEIIATLTLTIQVHPGHYLVFAPSHAYLETIRAAFVQSNPGVETRAQTPDMSAEERQQFISDFEKVAGTLVGFAVLGGIFAEGIDLRGEALVGAAIITVGLPGLNPETDRLRDYFDSTGRDGYAYAYRLPGFNNVLQAAGRVIRGSHDVGSILLIDSRFAGPDYAPLFPPHWVHARVSDSLADLAVKLEGFWRSSCETARP